MRYPFALLMCLVPGSLGGVAADAPVTLGLEAEEFQFLGDWQAQSGPPGTSGRGLLFAGPQGAALQAATAVSLPRAGRYHLWVRAMDFPDDRPGIRRCTVSVAGRRSEQTFGDSGKPDWSWEPGGAFDLPAGPALLGLHDVDRFYGRVDALLLTTDAAFTPTLALGRAGHPRVSPLALPVPEGADILRAGPVAPAGDTPAARIENEFVRCEFLPATREGKPTLCPRISVRDGERWVDAGADPSAEAYVVVASKGEPYRYSGFFPVWQGAPSRAFTVEAGGARLETAVSLAETPWNAGEVLRFVPAAARAEGGRAHLSFHPSPAGSLAAEWELRPGERAARLRLSFTPAAAGEYALGYHLPFRKPVAEVQELLLPMMWHRRRLPSRPTTLLDPFTPTPVALAQSAGPAGPLAWAVVGDPEMLPFAWPAGGAPHLGLMIRDVPGNVQPALYGPVPGTAAARAKAGQTVRLPLRVLVQPGDWYAGFRTAADQVYGWRDYRTNVGVSLTEAVLNMIDLVMDETNGGWWERAKGPYQIETLNGATHSSPLTLLSLYHLTGDPEVYRRRALPAMEYVLSRGNVHFSPEPANTGTHYPAGSMAGPANLYGTTVLGGFWEATRRRTPAFAHFALPETGVRFVPGYSHAEEFEEWLARHLLTGDAEALTKARALADQYLEKQILKPPTAEISPVPFFNISFVPDWEGLLRLYEVTGDRRYLEGAAFGARQLMTGIWTQPVVPRGEVTVHPGGEFRGSGLEHLWWKGPDKFRLGFPRRPGDTPERKVPAWIPSNVGLGFEQPVTYKRGDGPGAMIYQSAWAPAFLRLAAATGDPMFETYARNAVLGRWANYPGYYATGFTNLPLNPRYPLEGPDITSIYYHHILPHLAWSIDYLVSEAGLRSGGKIAFPALRQHGYAWFDSRTFGHAPGRVFGDEGVWLWLRRGLASVDSPALNTLTAHGERRFYLVLMNENSREEKATVAFSAKALGFDPAAAKGVRVLRDGGEGPALPLAGGKAVVTVPARGLLVLALDGVRVDVPAHRVPPAAAAGAHPGYAVVKSDAGPEGRAAAIQTAPGPWDAYVWCTASPKEARKVTLHFTTGGEWQTREDAEYPFEFSLPMADPAAALRFRLEGDAPDGRRFATPEAVVGAVP